MVYAVLMRSFLSPLYIVGMRCEGAPCAWMSFSCVRVIPPAMRSRRGWLCSVYALVHGEESVCGVSAYAPCASRHSVSRVGVGGDGCGVCSSELFVLESLCLRLSLSSGLCVYVGAGENDVGNFVRIRASMA